MNKMLLFVLILSTLTLNAYAEIDKRLCTMKDFDQRSDYILALKSQGGDYASIISFYRDVCGYNKKFKDLHAFSEDVLNLHLQLEEQNSWICVPTSKRSFYENPIAKEVGNTSVCFDKNEAQVQFYLVAYKSAYEDIEFKEETILFFFHKKYPVKTVFHIFDYKIYTKSMNQLESTVSGY